MECGLSDNTAKTWLAVRLLHAVEAGQDPINERREPARRLLTSFPPSWLKWALPSAAVCFFSGPISWGQRELYGGSHPLISTTKAFARSSPSNRFALIPKRSRKIPTLLMSTRRGSLPHPQQREGTQVPREIKVGLIKAQHKSHSPKGMSICAISRPDDANGFDRKVGIWRSYVEKGAQNNLALRTKSDTYDSNVVRR